VKIVNVSGTYKRKYEGQVNKTETDSMKKNIKDFYKGKNEFYNCNQPSIKMVKYETNCLWMPTAWKKPFPVATECEWGQG
jgi:hypothetical protein